MTIFQFLNDNESDIKHITQCLRLKSNYQRWFLKRVFSEQCCTAHCWILQELHLRGTQQAFLNPNNAFFFLLKCGDSRSRSEGPQSRLFIFASCHFLSKIKCLITHLISGVKAVCSTLWRFFVIQKIQVVLAELLNNIL